MQNEQNTPQVNIMLDLETLGQKPGSVIVSIGACKFGNGEITDTFYRRIDPESCVRAGLKMDASTILWWMQQSDEARQEICKEGKPLRDVLIDFARWLDGNNAIVWGNGAAFDNALLAAAYDAIGVAIPWKFYNDRCYRTVKSAHKDIPIGSYRTGTHHNALDDAMSQALHLMAILSRQDKAVELLRSVIPGFGYLLELVRPQITKVDAQSWEGFQEQALEIIRPIAHEGSLTI